MRVARFDAPGRTEVTSRPAKDRSLEGRADGFAQDRLHAGITSGARVYAIGGQRPFISAALIVEGAVIVGEGVMILRGKRADPGVQRGDQIASRRFPAACRALVAPAGWRNRGQDYRDSTVP